MTGKSMDIGGEKEHCRKEYLQGWNRKRNVGAISLRDAAVAHLPALPQIRCHGNGCYCSLLTKNREYQTQLRGDYCAFVKNSNGGCSGNKLLASYITPSKESDKNRYNKLLRNGKASVVIHFAYRLPGFRDLDEIKGDGVSICSAVFKKLFNLGKPRLKKLQGLSTQQCCGHPPTLQVTHEEAVLGPAQEQNEMFVGEGQPSPGIPTNVGRGIIRLDLADESMEEIIPDSPIRAARHDSDNPGRGVIQAIDVDSPGSGRFQVIKGPSIHIVEDDPLPHLATILSFGTPVDVEAKGNCGFLALMWGLCFDLDVVPEVRVHTFREALKEHALDHKERIFGMSFYRWGDRSRTEGEQKSFENKMWEENLEALFTKGESYETGAAVSGWLDGGKHFPIVADKYNVNIVIYVLDEHTPYTDVYETIPAYGLQQQNVRRTTEFSKLIPPSCDGLDKRRTLYLLLAEKHYQYLSVHRVL
jgi:hypothetical protein